MTADEARQLTKAALVNINVMQQIDKQIAKQAKDGKYKAEVQFYDSSGYSKRLTEIEYNALVESYRKAGFRVENDETPKSEYLKMTVSWYDEGTPAESSNVD